MNSLRLACGEPPPSEREAKNGSLSEGAVSVADWGECLSCGQWFVNGSKLRFVYQRRINALTEQVIRKAEAFGGLLGDGN